MLFANFLNWIHAWRESPGSGNSAEFTDDFRSCDIHIDADSSLWKSEADNTDIIHVNFNYGCQHQLSHLVVPGPPLWDIQLIDQSFHGVELLARADHDNRFHIAKLLTKSFFHRSK